MSLMIKPKCIWIVNTDSHGTVGYWDTREGAVREAHRIFKQDYEDGETELNIWEEEDFIDDDDFYGTMLVNAVCVELNKQW